MEANVQKSGTVQALGDFVRFSVTTHVLRCIDKAGGLDNYILGTPPHILNSTTGRPRVPEYSRPWRRRARGQSEDDEG